MKTSFPNPFFLSFLLVGVTLIGVSQASGQTFTTLYSFKLQGTSSPYTNTDGAKPNAALLLSGNTLYGTTKNGGSSGNGTLFAMNTNATVFTNLHIFTATSGGFLPNFYN